MQKEKNWDEIWKEYKGLNWFGKRLVKKQRKILEKILDELNLEKDSKIIDVGCGTGRTLSFFRSLGYEGSIGIDVSENSLKLCQEIFGFELKKDVFYADGSNTNFEDGRFDLVFSEGLLEHFKDFFNFVKEFSRISKQYILIFQPNPGSLFGRAKRFFQKIRVTSWEFEYLYNKNSYTEAFEKFGFRLRDSGGINLGEEMWLLFEKVEH